MVFVSTDLPPTAKGSFTLATDGVATKVESDEFIQIDGLKRYELSAYLKQDNPAAATDINDGYAYFGVVCYDREQQRIEPWHVNERAGTRTVLFEDLKPGDTVMHVRTAANWADPTTITDPRNNHRRPSSSGTTWTRAARSGSRGRTRATASTATTAGPAYSSDRRRRDHTPRALRGTGAPTRDRRRATRTPVGATCTAGTGRCPEHGPRSTGTCRATRRDQRRETGSGRAPCT